VNNAGFTESGTTDFNLRVDGQTHGTVSGEAGVQVSGQATFKSGLTIRPLLSLSAEGLGDSSWSPTAQFVEGPVAEGFRSMTALPQALGKVSAAVQLSKGQNWSLQHQYAAQAGDGYIAQSGGGAFIARF